MDSDSMSHSSSSSASAAVAAATGAEPRSSPSESQTTNSVKVFKPPSTDSASWRLPPPPAEDPKPTASEIKAAFVDHIAQRHGPDAPLMTRAMREKEDIRLGRVKRTYESVRIRIRFSDRTQIESTFPSKSTLPVIYDFVKSTLSPEAAGKPFTLYQTPPKRDLLPNDPKLKGKTLSELGMVPAAVLSIRWSDPEMNGNSFPAPLKQQLLSSAQDLPPPPTFDGPSAAGGQGKTAGGTDSKEGESKPKESKPMPKWLKGLAGKK
ncbi:hypothetical protein IE53DRAFT_389121 [Violaceomyces palustris]|uniref:Uncharacterized protein n=1 Tax=Violaceomyces palustris TaxID=1673888 RepID=A0ACD0NS81_9BASI|nr:hypothetical protein IE53DRAFT_389121 [Violaceomyces palustris]